MSAAGGFQLGANGKAAGGFYSEEAARLALEAATRQQQPAAPAPEPAEPGAKYVPSILLEEPQRPLLKPQPAINQNVQPARTEPTLDDDVRPARPLRRSETITEDEDVRPARAARRRETYDDDEDHAPLGVAKVVAWIILAPWYLAMLAAALGVIGLFARGFF